MITIIFEQNREYIADEIFPAINAKVTFDDEDSATDILDGMVSLLRYAGFIVTKKSWEEAGEEINAKSHFDEVTFSDAEIALIE